MHQIRRRFITGLIAAAIVVSPTQTPLAQPIIGKGDPLAAIEAQLKIIAQQIAALQSTRTVVSIWDGSGETLAEGSRGPEVAEFQRLLAGLSGIYPEGVVSGYFGPLTKEAVRRFQRSRNLAVTGVIDSITRAELKEATSVAVVVVSNSSGSSEMPQYNISSLERLVQQKVNKERTQRGLKALKWDSTLSQVSRLHSADQAGDNVMTTRPDSPCTYPLIRHEGLDGNESVLDRTLEFTRDFRRVGENIVAFPLTTKLIYRYSKSSGPTKCPTLEPYNTSSEVDFDERVEAFEEAGELRERIVESLEPVQWIDREWIEEEDIAEKAVRLWMNSEGHRRNILREHYTHGGIGIELVNNYIIITHVMIERQ